MENNTTEYLGEFENQEIEGSQILENETSLENNTTEYLGEFENQENESLGRSENKTSLEIDYYVYQTEIGKGIGYRLEKLRKNIRSLRIEVREFSELIQKTNYESKKRIDEMRLKYSSYRSRKR